MNTSPRYARYTQKMLAQSVGAPSGFNLAGFQNNYYAPCGPGQITGNKYFSRDYRVAEITDPASAAKVSGYIDHHLGCAWKIVCEFAGKGYVPPGYIPSTDSPAVICEMIRNHPEWLRDRLDAALEGLRIDIDPAGVYEAAMVSWTGAWYSTMNEIFIATKGKPARRLAMCRQAAKEAYPVLLAWFEKLRHDVLDGGYDSNWVSGDRLREEACA